MISSLYVVSVPVVNLRRRPIDPSGGRRDPDQETQLLLGELVKPISFSEGWCFIEAIEQSYCHSDGRWSGYPGWVRSESIIPLPQHSEGTYLVNSIEAPLRSEAKLTAPIIHVLSLGSRITAKSIGGEWLQVAFSDFPPLFISSSQVTSGGKDRAQTVVATARQMLGFPYFWGGRSTPARSAEGASLRSVDCSGLVNLAYRLAGIDTPRNAHDQYLRSRQLELSSLKAGDLLFLDSNKKGRIDHVMIFDGVDCLIEAAGSCDAVREISIEERLGFPLNSLEQGALTLAGKIYGGTLFN